VESLKQEIYCARLGLFESMLKRNIQFNEKAKIIIDTIHSVKGGEADNVLIYEKANWPSNFQPRTSKTRWLKRGCGILVLHGVRHPYIYSLLTIHIFFLWGVLHLISTGEL